MNSGTPKDGLLGRFVRVFPDANTWPSPTFRTRLGHIHWKCWYSNGVCYWSAVPLPEPMEVRVYDFERP